MAQSNRYQARFTLGHRSEAQSAHTGEFGMCVEASSREKGVGHALLRSFLDWASTHPTLEKVCLKVHATNERAIGLYRSLDFVTEGKAVRDLKYGPDLYVDSMLMAKFVKPFSENPHGIL